MRSIFKNLAALALLLIGCADAFWRMNCAPIQTGRVDPLVNPGTVAAHAHLIVGGSNIGVNSTYNTLLNSECSSCEIEADKSAYWTPLLYYAYPNGSFYEVPHGGSVIYYLARGPNENSTVPYPKGMQILTGDKGARSYDNVTMTWGNATYPGRPIADRISFVCLTEGASPADQPWMFNTSCINGMRAQIVFQSCWNGKDLYKSDNSHVAYLNDLDNGICPPGYPVQIPTLFIEVNYAVSLVPNQGNGGYFVFSQGDPTGYGFHADFQNGWDSDVLAYATRNCLVPDNFGQVSACPALQATQNNGFPWNCPERPPQIGEPVHGLIPKLPGCINVTWGPGEAPAASMACPAGYPKPSITSTVNGTPRPTPLPTYGAQFGLPNHDYLGCFNDSAGALRTLNEASTVNYTVMSVEWCQNWCNQQGYRLSGVEYAQECHCDNELNPTALNGSTQCSWNCGSTMLLGTGNQEICGGYGYISVYNNTDPSFVAFGNMDNTAGNARPYTPPAGFGPTYMGCYSDGYNGAPRTLAGASFAQNNMTIELCAAFCASGSGYQYYGLEFSTQCYCGNVIGVNGTLLNATTTPTNQTCQKRCGGAEPEICGGPNGLSLYNNTAYTPPKQKQIGKYVPKGCLTDPAIGGRSIQGASMSNAAMTQEMCVKFCLGKQYHYAAIEYGDECYCGNSIVTSTGGAQVTCDTSQLRTCPGNIFEYCGGPSLMNLWYSATL